jgi:hypothetical protein
MQVYSVNEIYIQSNDMIKYAIIDGNGNYTDETYDEPEDAETIANGMNRETYKNIYTEISILRDKYDHTEHDGLIGFSTLTDAENVAQDTGGEVRLLFRKRNSSYFSDLGYQVEYLTPHDYIERQDDHESLMIATEDEIICAAKNYMDIEVNTLYDLYNLCDEFERLVSRFRSKSENQEVIMRNGKYIFTIDKQLMEFYSVYGFYTIGVMF